MVLGLLLAEVFYLTANNFAEHEPKIVKFFAPWCGHCKAFAPEFERLSTLTDIATGEVDCTVEKELCGKYGVYGFPTVKFFWYNRSFEYRGSRAAEDIIRFMTEMQLPPLAYGREAPSKGNWFEYFTNDIDADYHYFESVKGDAMLIVRQGESLLRAHIEGYEIDFGDYMTEASVSLFIRRFRHGLFPQINYDIFADLFYNRLAIYVHDGNESLNELKYKTLSFNRTLFTYANMDGKQYGFLAYHFGCTEMPCGLVVDGKNHYAQVIQSFDDFYPFVQRVENGEVAAHKIEPKHLGPVKKALYNVKWVVEDFLAPKSQTQQALYVAGGIISLGLLIVLPLVLCIASCWVKRSQREADISQTAERSAVGPIAQKPVHEPPYLTEIAQTDRVAAERLPTQADASVNANVRDDADTNAVSEQPMVKKAAKKGRRED